MSHGPSTAARRRSARFIHEQLESRRLFAAVPQAVLDAGFEPVEWNGETVYAMPGRWLLQLNGVDGAPAAQVEKANRQLGRLNANVRATKHLGRDGLLLLEAPKELGPGKLKHLLGDLDNVSYVEPDGALWADASTPNDPSYPSLWGMNNTGQTGGTPDADIDAPEAWDVVRGDGGVVVGVVDTGIDYKHPDLAANMWVNPGEVAGNRKDDDGNGYVDDVHGWDFFNGDKDPMDDHGHGTHVSGTIAGRGDNGTGVVGVNWNAKLMALKQLGSEGSGPWSAAAEAINYATTMKTRYGVNVDVTNNSYGGWGFSQALYDAVRINRDAGMLFVAAAGNGGSNIDRGGAYPAAFDLDNIVGVASTDHNDALASTSNRGTANVDLAAPGVGILSTMPRNGYATKNGTSMAAPHVAGVAALAWAYRPDASAARVRAAILTGVDRVAPLAGVVATGGRLNAPGTLSRVDATYADPATPLGLEASSVTTGALTLTWQSNNDPDVEGYNVYRSTSGGPMFLVAKLSAGSTTFRNVSLLPGTTYAYQITARNYLSVESAASNVVQATTLGDPIYIPAAPTNLTAASASRTQINLAWTDNSTDETAFEIERSTDGTNWSLIAQAGANVTTYTNSDLKRNVRFYYRVRASNRAGYSDYSNVASAVTGASADGAALPAAPPAAVGVFASALVRSSPPLDGDKLRVAEAVLA